MKKLRNKYKNYNKIRPLIIAEISGNHNGNKSRFLKLIKSAILNGADLIKIQTYEPKDITLNSKLENFKIKKVNGKIKLWKFCKGAHTPFAWHKEAFQLAKKYNKRFSVLHLAFEQLISWKG